VSTNERDIDEQPEIATTWPPKPEVLILSKYYQNIKIPTENRGFFDHGEFEENVPRRFQ